MKDIKIKHKNGIVLDVKEINEDMKAKNDEVILYLKDQERGFWLIDSKNVKQPLYYTLNGLYEVQKGFNDIRQDSIEWLKKGDKK